MKQQGRGAERHSEERLVHNQVDGGDCGVLVQSCPADITVFSQDIMTIPEADILKVTPLLTVVGGKIVHDGR